MSKPHYFHRAFLHNDAKMLPTTKTAMEKVHQAYKRRISPKLSNDWLESTYQEKTEDVFRER